MKYDYVLFDLDGTLTDPAVGITESVIYALEKSGVTPPERESLYKFIGPPLMYSFREYCGMTEEARGLADYLAVREENAAVANGADFRLE